MSSRFCPECDEECFGCSEPLCGVEPCKACREVPPKGDLLSQGEAARDQMLAASKTLREMLREHPYLLKPYTELLKSISLLNKELYARNAEGAVNGPEE